MKNIRLTRINPAIWGRSDLQKQLFLLAILKGKSKKVRDPDKIYPEKTEKTCWNSLRFLYKKYSVLYKFLKVFVQKHKTKTAEAEKNDSNIQEKHTQKSYGLCTKAWNKNSRNRTTSGRKFFKIYIIVRYENKRYNEKLCRKEKYRYTIERKNRHKLRTYSIYRTDTLTKPGLSFLIKKRKELPSWKQSGNSSKGIKTETSTRLRRTVLAFQIRFKEKNTFFTLHIRH